MLIWQLLLKYQITLLQYHQLEVFTLLICYHIKLESKYEKKAYTVMVNNATNINKCEQLPLNKIIEHKNDHDHDIPMVT